MSKPKLVRLPPPLPGDIAAIAVVDSLPFNTMIAAAEGCLRVARSRHGRHFKHRALVAARRCIARALEMNDGR